MAVNNHEKVLNEHTNLIGINTKGVKFYLTRPEEGHHPMKKVVAVPSQTLPEELLGGFTDVASARRAFEAYMSRVNRKVRKAAADSTDDGSEVE